MKQWAVSSGQLWRLLICAALSSGHGGRAAAAWACQPTIHRACSGALSASPSTQVPSLSCWRGIARARSICISTLIGLRLRLGHRAWANRALRSNAPLSKLTPHNNCSLGRASWTAPVSRKSGPPPRLRQRCLSYPCRLRGQGAGSFPRPAAQLQASASICCNSLAHLIVGRASTLQASHHSLFGVNWGPA